MSSMPEKLPVSCEQILVPVGIHEYVEEPGRCAGPLLDPSHVPADFGPSEEECSVCAPDLDKWITCRPLQYRSVECVASGELRYGVPLRLACRKDLASVAHPLDMMMVTRRLALHWEVRSKVIACAGVGCRNNKVGGWHSSALCAACVRNRIPDLDAAFRSECDERNRALALMDSEALRHMAEGMDANTIDNCERVCRQLHIRSLASERVATLKQHTATRGSSAALRSSYCGRELRERRGRGRGANVGA